MGSSKQDGCRHWNKAKFPVMSKNADILHPQNASQYSTLLKVSYQTLTSHYKLSTKEQKHLQIVGRSEHLVQHQFSYHHRLRGREREREGVENRVSTPDFNTYSFYRRLCLHGPLSLPIFPVLHRNPIINRTHNPHPPLGRGLDVSVLTGRLRVAGTISCGK